MSRIEIRRILYDSYVINVSIFIFFIDLGVSFHKSFVIDSASQIELLANLLHIVFEIRKRRTEDMIQSAIINTNNKNMHFISSEYRCFIHVFDYIEASLSCYRLLRILCSFMCFQFFFFRLFFASSFDGYNSHSL